jgi:hypothetical protein
MRKLAAQALALVLVFGLPCPKFLLAQQPQKPSAEKPEVQVFGAKYVKATELARIIREMCGQNNKSVRITTDDATNAVIVSADAEDLMNIRQIIAKLDVDSPERGADRLETKIFQLKVLQPDKHLEEVLRLVFGQGNARFAVDRDRKFVVVHGDAKSLETAAVLLQRLEDQVAVKPKPPEEVQVRVVWLATGLDRKDAAKPPRDLADVLEELARIGIEDPRLVSQTVINVLGYNPFDMEGSAKLEASCRFTVSGQFIDLVPGERPVLQITINATDEGSKPVCRIQTQIKAPPGHSVVLGVTPTETVTSIFVVQVLPKKPASVPGSKR